MLELLPSRPALHPAEALDGYLERLAAVAAPARTQGAAIHDARIAALCLHHGVTQLWTADRDFTRFPELAVRNPLVG